MSDNGSTLHGETTTALEKGVANVVVPINDFIRDQKTASAFLLITTVLALVIANSPLAHDYEQLIETPLGFVLGDIEFAMSLHAWVNEGLMALFFFIIGCEIKRDLLVGELNDLSRAVPVFAAAAGGMLFPALFFVLLNQQGSAIHGWAIPMATDTAFAVGVLAMLRGRVPAGLTTFLLALAIIDDMGAVLVIATFYSSDISLPHLGMAGALLTVLILMNLAGMRRSLLYMMVGGLVWLAMLGSGVHATMAGILVAMTIPARPAQSTRNFVRRGRELIDEFEHIEQEESKTSPVLAEPEKHEVLEDLKDTAARTTTPLQLWESALEHPVALFVLPLFALVNAGIAIDPSTLPSVIGDSLALGIVLGLVAGKVIGISIPTLVMLKYNLGRLPKGVHPSHIVGLGLLGGIGFTMSMFIAGLGFGDQPEQLLIAKSGILTASLLAGVLGYLWLRFATPDPSDD